MRRFLNLSLLAATVLFAGPGVGAETKKEAPTAPPPQVVVTMPLGVEAGKATRLTVRGVGVDAATEVRVSDPKATGKVVGKAKKVPVPAQQNASLTGDSEIEIDVTVPAEVPGTLVPFTLIGPGGESKPHQLIVNDGARRVAEKEPNSGFRQAQPVQVPQVVEGVVSQPQDVDVFRIDGKAGARLTFEVQAARFGSPLEAMLTLYDRDGRVIATADGSSGSRDPLLRVTLPADGPYYVALIDANDQGGPIWVYRLVIRAGG